MVWNSTQSALYRAVNDHNDGIFERDIQSKKNVRKNVQKSSDIMREKNEKKRPENHERKCTQNVCRNCPKNAPSDPVSRIMSDRDMLLIAGLIFILWRENADRKLIMALAMIFLG